METESKHGIEQEIGQLLVDYVALNDARRWPELASLFVVEAELVRPSAPDQPIIGRDAILASFLARPADRRMRHVCANVQVTVQSATAATATSTYVIYAGTLLAIIPNVVIFLWVRRAYKDVGFSSAVKG